jgi:hypothetical protein
MLNWKNCMRCGRAYQGPGALSRADNKTEVCPDCGTAEAVEDFKSAIAKRKGFLKMRIKIDENVIQGNSYSELLEGLRTVAYDPEQYKTIDDFVDYLKSAMWRLAGFGLVVRGDTQEEKCKSVIEQLATAKYIDLEVE